MTKIKSDKLGLYVNGGGYVSRPKGKTQYNVGDEVKTYHFGGSVNVGVGKDDTCKKGQYLETWMTSGIACFELKDFTDEEIKKKWDWYVNYEKTNGGWK